MNLQKRVQGEKQTPRFDQDNPKSPQKSRLSIIDKLKQQTSNQYFKSLISSIKTQKSAEKNPYIGKLGRTVSGKSPHPIKLPNYLQYQMKQDLIEQQNYTKKLLNTNVEQTLKSPAEDYQQFREDILIQAQKALQKFFEVKRLKIWKECKYIIQQSKKLQIKINQDEHKIEQVNDKLKQILARKENEFQHLSNLRKQYYQNGIVLFKLSKTLRTIHQQKKKAANRSSESISQIEYLKNAIKVTMKFLNVKDTFINLDGKYVYVFQNQETLMLKNRQATPIEIQQLWDILKKKKRSYFELRYGKRSCNTCIFRMKKKEIDEGRDEGGVSHIDRDYRMIADF